MNLYKIIKEIRLIIICIKNLNFDEIPEEFFFLFFYNHQKHQVFQMRKVIKINNQLYGLNKSDHKKTPANNPIKINTPPIVGVPIFFIRCSSGPSNLIGFVIFFVEKNL